MTATTAHPAGPGSPAEAAGQAALVLAERIADGRVLRLIVNAPKANIYSMAVMAALGDALDAAASDPALKLVVLRGAGRHFSFGASVEEHRKDSAAAMLASFHAFIRKVAAYPVPVAALVEGRCLGGAFEVALACHLIFASETAVFACPEIKLGVFPPVLAALGPVRLGSALSEQLLLTGGELDAAGAQRAGLLTALLAADGDHEVAVVAWYETNFAPLSALAIRQATRVSRRAGGVLDALAGPLDLAERQYVEELLVSHDGNEGIEAFLARRPAVWKDR